MRKRLLFTLTALFVLVGSVPAFAQWQYVGFEQITVDNTAGGKGFTAAKIDPPGLPQATQAFCQSETAETRYTVDGTTVTTAVGTVLPIAGQFQLNGHDLLVKFRAIRTGGSSATYNCTYFAGATSVQTSPFGGGAGGGGGGGGSVTQGTNPWIVAPASGSFATDGTFDSAVPLTGPAVGFRAETTTPTAMADGDQVYPWADTLGALSVRAAYDPCGQIAKSFAVINISTATTTEVTPSLSGAGNYYYICSLELVNASADNVALVDDDTDNCASVTSGMAGGTTAATGWNFGANSGLARGNGLGALYKTNGTNRVVCLVTSAATQLSGVITYVAAP